MDEPHSHGLQLPADPATYAAVTADLIRGDVRSGGARAIDPRVRFVEDQPGHDEWLDPSVVNARGEADCSSIPRAEAALVRAGQAPATHVIVIETPTGLHAALWCESLAPGVRVVNRRFVGAIPIESVREKCSELGMNGGRKLAIGQYQAAWVEPIWTEGVRPIAMTAAHAARAAAEYEAGLRARRGRTWSEARAMNIGQLIQKGIDDAAALAEHIESQGAAWLGTVLETATPAQARQLAALYTQGAQAAPAEPEEPAPDAPDMGAAVDPSVAFTQIASGSNPLAAFTQIGQRDPRALFGLFQSARGAAPGPFGAFMSTLSPASAGPLADLLTQGKTQHAQNPLTPAALQSVLGSLAGGGGAPDASVFGQVGQILGGIGGGDMGYGAGQYTYQIGGENYTVPLTYTIQQLQKDYDSHLPLIHTGAANAFNTSILPAFLAAQKKYSKPAAPSSPSAPAPNASGAHRNGDHAVIGGVPSTFVTTGGLSARGEPNGRWVPDGGQAAPIPQQPYRGPVAGGRNPNAPWQANQGSQGPGYLWWQQPVHAWPAPQQGWGNWGSGWAARDPRRIDPSAIFQLLQSQQGDPRVIFRQYHQDGGDMAALVQLLRQQMDEPSLTQFLGSVAQDDGSDDGIAPDDGGGFVDMTNGGGSLADIDGPGPDMSGAYAPLDMGAGADSDDERDRGPSADPADYLSSGDDEEVDLVAMLMGDNSKASPCACAV